jgi:L-aminopeptidase/D-esterase-like protein
MKLNNTITDVPGIEVGQAQDEEALTGCTVILCRKGAVAGVDVRGSAPGTRETDLLNPINLVQKIHAVVLAGGSAFGLDAASGVMRYLAEKKIGLAFAGNIIPIVPAAIIFDLNLGKIKKYPDSDMGYLAASSATSGSVKQGNFGAGTGATVGKIFGQAGAMKSGVGSASMEIGGGVVVGAIVAVNAFGDVRDPETGQIVAGARSIKMGPVKLGKIGRFADTLEVMKSGAGRAIVGLASRSNTVIAAVATNARLNKSEATKMAQMAQDGVARTISPAHTMWDGDTVFALATGQRKADVNIVGAFAAQVLAQAIINAVNYAEPAAGLPSTKSYT